MNYRSIADLSNILRYGANRVPTDVDLIVGVPRSGMLVANLLALQLNIRFCDVQNFLSDTPLHQGHTRVLRHAEVTIPSKAKHALVIDDSIDSGDSLNNARHALASSNFPTNRLTWAACFAAPNTTKDVDLYFEVVPQPRLFEWNLMHRPFLAECCIDIDGVLCADPTADENDDGARYHRFLLTARPLALPSYPLGTLVTSRLEKYRAETQSWLAKNGVVYKKLCMLDLPDAATRQRLRPHAEFKASVFRDEFASRLFIESEPKQAQDIARLSGKHCLCYSTQTLYDPSLSYELVEYRTKHLTQRALRKMVRMGKQLAGLR